MKKLPVPFLGLALAFALAAGTLYTVLDRPATPAPESPVPIGGPFKLIGPDGQEITDKSFPGKWTLVFFGYTFCPDICPTTMADIGAALEALGPDAAKVQPLFITVDPARDTPAVLKDYMSHFDSRILGLTGSPEAIAAVQQGYKIYAAARPEQEGVQLFDHSALIYLMSPEGRYGAHFAAGTPGRDMAEGIRRQIGAGPNSGAS